MNNCVKPYSDKNNPYNKQDNPYSNKTSPFSKLDSPFSSKEDPYGKICIDETIKLFQDDSRFVMQNKNQFIFNLA